MPESVEMPAPVRTANRRPASTATRAETSEVVVDGTAAPSGWAARSSLRRADRVRRCGGCAGGGGGFGQRPRWAATLAGQDTGPCGLGCAYRTGLVCRGAPWLTT